MAWTWDFKRLVFPEPESQDSIGRKHHDGGSFTNIVGTHPLTLDHAWEAARMAGLEQDIKEMQMGMHTFIM